MRVKTGPGGVEVRPVASNCSVRRNRALLFNFDIDDASLKKEHQDWLDSNVIPFLVPAARVTLHGTASRSGSDQHNLGLSQRRLKTIKDYLLSRGAQSTQIAESANGEDDARRAGQRNGTEDPRFRAVDVALEAPVTASVRVRVHPLDRNTHRVPSILGANGKDHFVAAKNTGDVILEALATGCIGNVTWEARDEAGLPVPIIFPALGGNVLTARLSSSISRKIHVRLLAGRSVLWDGFVWIVYATISARPIADLNLSSATTLQLGLGFDFTHTITPASIFATPGDIPDLTGPKTPGSVPGGTNHAGNSLQGGADRKWDNSRKIRKKFLNPANIPLASIPGGASFHSTFPNYPSAADGDGHPGGVGAIDPDLVSIVGNDDAGTGDPEDNDPYTDPDRGKLTGTDQPSRTMRHAVGADGNTVEWKLHFIEFTRLELGGRWYRISDDFPWRSHIRMRRAGGRWVDNNSVKALNNADF